MVVADDRRDRPQVGHGADERLPVRGVLAHQRPPVLVERARHRQDRARDADLADVVQEPGEAAAQDVRGRAAEPPRDAGGEQRHVEQVRVAHTLGRGGHRRHRLGKAERVGLRVGVGVGAGIGGGEAHAVAPAALGRVERAVGGDEQRFDVARPRVGDRGADGHGDGDVLVARPHGLGGDVGAHVLGDVEQRGLVEHARQQEQELLAAHAHDVVLLAHALAQPLGQAHQHRVARGVAVEVVDLLEVVDVDREHADGPVAEPVEARGQRAAVRRAGEVVDLGEALRLRARGLELELRGVDRGDVEHGAVEEAAAVLDAHAAAVADPADAPVGAHELVVDVEAPGLVRAAVGGVEGLDPVGMHVVRPHGVARLLDRHAEEALATGAREADDGSRRRAGTRRCRRTPRSRRGCASASRSPPRPRPPCRRSQTWPCSSIGAYVMRLESPAARMAAMTPSANRDDTVLVLGLGDLGLRVVDVLSQWRGGRLVTAARDAEHARAVAGQAALVAALCDGPRAVEPAVADLDDRDGIAELLARVQPDVIVVAASRLTWWRVPERALSLPYGVWLPLHVPLVRALMQARNAAGVGAPVVALPFPDAVGPVLAGIGLAPETGAGNVLEMAAKLVAVVAERAGVERDAVDVRLVAHHATERLAFSAFLSVAGTEGAPPGPPPLHASVSVNGEAVPDDEVRELLTAAYPLLSGHATHELTAAATAATVWALLSDEPRRLHVPAPAGRPGGYPVRISRAGIELDLPPGMTEADAIAVNAVAARWDGIERIEPDGAFVYSRWVSDELERTLGLRLERVEPAESDAIADELVARLGS